MPAVWSYVKFFLGTVEMQKQKEEKEKALLQVQEGFRRVQDSPEAEKEAVNFY